MQIPIWIVLLIAVAGAVSGQAQGTLALPADIYPDSLNRLPTVKREKMDDKGKEIYDRVAGGPGKVISPTGPVAIQIHNPEAAEALRRLNEFLRRPGNSLGDAIAELAILIAAREVDSQYLWSAHEPAALKAGISQPTIDIVKNRKEISGLGEKEALVVRLGRQLLRDHKLDSDTFAKSVVLFGEQGTLELVTLIADYTLNGLVLHAFDQRLPADRPPLLPPR